MSKTKFQFEGVAQNISMLNDIFQVSFRFLFIYIEKILILLSSRFFQTKKTNYQQQNIFDLVGEHSELQMSHHNGK